jgi:type II secretory pathway component PulJ
MEVLAAVFLTTVVITAAVTFYINLSSSATRATQTMRRELHASAVLDRLSRDLESASLLTKPNDVDPLAHPWYFVAEGQHAFSGADRVKFLSRGQKPRASASHGSDLAQIVYFTERAEDESLTLYRWLAYGLPTQYPVEYPSAEDERSFVLADGLETFSMRFLGEGGEWAEEWDSTQLVDSSQLPIAVELSLTFRDDAVASDRDGLDEVPVPYAQTVVLSSRPLDLVGLIEEKLALLAEQQQSTVQSATSAAGADGTGEPTVSCLDLCLSVRPESFCNQLISMAADAPEAAAFRAEFNCR